VNNLIIFGNNRYNAYTPASSSMDLRNACSTSVLEGEDEGEEGDDDC
jgi:hypothetical protein